MSRYKVVEGSQSAHCCFEATVVDTTKPVMIGGKQYKDQFDAVCECFDYSEAERIAQAMNDQNLPIRTPEGRQIREAFLKESKIVGADFRDLEHRVMAMKNEPK